MQNPRLLRTLALAFLSGEQTAPAVFERASHCLGREWPWLRPLAKRYVRCFAAAPDVEDVLRFLASSHFYRFALDKFGPEIQIQNWVTPDQARRIAGWNLPHLLNTRDLCRWLAIDFDHLEWFADRRRIGYRTGHPKLEHYTYRVLAKPGGSIRLIEAPKKSMKELQRRIARDLLARVPAHSAVHGFVEGRSIRTFVAGHSGKDVVLRLDLKNFFPSIYAARVEALFRTLGYSERVADFFAALCLNSTPRRVWKGLKLESNAFHELWSMYARPHLPQGAPTSPAIANLCAYHMDRRLDAFARSAGAHYTRYADDLAFSGNREFARCAPRFAMHVAAIAMEEGFQVNHRKTRIMHQGVRQHLAGLTVNRHPNIGRDEFDRLKAILVNCVHYGPASQNREHTPDFRANLFGRISFVASINPQKAARLKKLFDKIEWQ